MTKKIAPIDFPNPRVITGTISITLLFLSQITRVISGPYFPVFGPEITLYLDTFHAMKIL